MKRQQKYSNAENQGFIIHESTIRMSSLLSDEELGRLIRQFYLYAEQGEAPDEEPNLAVAIIFNEWRLQFDYDKQQYASACQKRSEAGRKGMANRWQKTDATADDLCKDKDNDNDNTLVEEDNHAPSATAENHSALLATAEDNAAPLATTDDAAAPLAVAEDNTALHATADDNTATSDIANDSNAMQAITKITDNDNDIDDDINKKEISPKEKQRKKFLWPLPPPSKRGRATSTRAWCLLPTFTTVRCSTTSTSIGPNLTSDGGVCASRCRRPGRPASAFPPGRASNSAVSQRLFFTMPINHIP